MEIKLTSENLKYILKKYYGNETEIKFNLTEGDRYSEIETHVVIQKKINLLGEVYQVSENLPKDKVIEILNQLLDSEGYSVESLYFNSGYDLVGIYETESLVLKEVIIKLSKQKNYTKGTRKCV